MGQVKGKDTRGSSTMRAGNTLLKEAEILKEIEFELATPTVVKFLGRNLRVSIMDDFGSQLAGLLAELTLMDVESFRYAPSALAAAAVLASARLSNHPAPWSKAMEKHTGYASSELEDCVEKMLKAFEQCPESQFQSLPKKYESVLRRHGYVPKCRRQPPTSGTGKSSSSCNTCHSAGNTPHRNDASESAVSTPKPSTAALDENKSSQKLPKGPSLATAETSQPSSVSKCGDLTSSGRSAGAGRNTRPVFQPVLRSKKGKRGLRRL